MMGLLCLSGINNVSAGSNIFLLQDPINVIKLRQVEVTKMSSIFTVKTNINVTADIIEMTEQFNTLQLACAKYSEVPIIKNHCDGLIQEGSSSLIKP
jgi:hypothetical protein